MPVPKTEAGPEGKPKKPKKSQAQWNHERREAELFRALSTGVGFVRVFEAAAYFGVTRQTLWEWVRSGRLPKPTQISAQVSGWAASIIRDASNGERKAAA